MFARWPFFSLPMRGQGEVPRNCYGKNSVCSGWPICAKCIVSIQVVTASQPTPTIIYEIKKLLTTLLTLGFIQQRNPILFISLLLFLPAELCVLSIVEREKVRVESLIIESLALSQQPIDKLFGC